MSKDLVLSIAFNDLLRGILIIVAIIAIIYLIQLLAKAKKIVEHVNDLVEKNKEELDATIKSLPGITEKADASLDKAQDILNQSSDDIVKTIAGAKDTASNASKISADVADTVEFVSMAAVDAADSFSSGASKASSVVTMIQEFIRAFRASSRRK